MPKIRHRGSIKYSEPTDIEKPDKLIDTDDLHIERQKPNRVKLGIEEGETRFPPESVAPNKRKYDEKGRYVKHQKSVQKKKEERKVPSMTEIMKNSSLSNPYRKKNGGK